MAFRHNLTLYRRFWIGIILRSLLIACACFGLVLAIVVERALWSPIIIVSFFVVIWSVGFLVQYIMTLIDYVEKSNQNLSSLLFSIKAGDFKNNYPVLEKSPHFEKLTQALNDIMMQFHKIGFEKESYLQLLQTLNENIQVALISTDQAGQILTINDSAKALTQLTVGDTIAKLQTHDNTVFEILRDLQPNERKVVLLTVKGEQNHFVIHVKEVRVHDRTIKIYLLQNVSVELDDKEIEAWSELASVLTHEIMNSVTPIVSLTTAVNKLLRPDSQKEVFSEGFARDHAKHVYDSLDVVQRRGKNLMNFVKAYKTFTTLPELNLSPTDVNELLQKTIVLCHSDSPNENLRIRFSPSVQPLVRPLDEVLIEQAFINIIKNAQEALSNRQDGEIIVFAEESAGCAKIMFQDNGEGIDEDTLRKIFIPFFTTKPKGTGIGLSLSRQIIKLHKGKIHVTSKKDKGTTVVIEL